MFLSSILVIVYKMYGNDIKTFATGCWCFGSRNRISD